LPAAPCLDAAALRAALDAGAVVIDARESSSFKAGHVAGALSVPDEPTFATRAAWFAQPDVQIVLITRPVRVEALVRALIRVGLDRIEGFVDASDLSATAGLPAEPLKSIAIETAEGRWRSGAAVVIDVRSSLEYRHGHIPGALHIPAGKLLGALDRVPRNRPLMVHCAGGGRSSAAASALMSQGYKDVEDVAGGFDAWEAAGNPTETGSPAQAESVPS
jgi:hydroxyacylglutathione hydrolase